MSTTATEKCPHCGFDNSPGRTICWQCKGLMTAAVHQPSVAAAGQPTASTSAAAKRRDHRLLCVLGFACPLVGLILGVYGLTREPDAAWQNTGRAVLMWAIIGLTISMVSAGIVYGVVSYYQAEYESMKPMFEPVPL